MVGGLEIPIPPEFGRDHETRYIHGGWRWVSNRLELEVVNGYWQEVSFRGHPSEPPRTRYEECRTHIEGYDVFVARLERQSRQHGYVWFSDARLGGGVMVAVSAPTREAREDLLRIVASIRQGRR